MTGPSVECICVDPARIKEVWPKVSALIYTAMKRGGLGSFAIVEQDVLDGKMLLWLAVNDGLVDGAAVTSLERTEWDKTCVIVACGGKEVSQWIGCISKIEEFAKLEGCNSVRIYGREGWIRLLPDYRPKRVVLEKGI